jgi:hypothetical protein
VLAEPVDPNRASTSLALAGLGSGARPGAICQARTRRAGGSQTRTRPQWQVKPWGPRLSAAYSAGRSWTAQPLPSGSAKKTKEFQRPPGPSTRSAPS